MKYAVVMKHADFMIDKSQRDIVEAAMCDENKKVIYWIDLAGVEHISPRHAIIDLVQLSNDFPTNPEKPA